MLQSNHKHIVRNCKESKFSEAMRSSIAGSTGRSRPSTKTKTQEAVFCGLSVTQALLSWPEKGTTSPAMNPLCTAFLLLGCDTSPCVQSMQNRWQLAVWTIVKGLTSSAPVLLWVLTLGKENMWGLWRFRTHSTSFRHLNPRRQAAHVILNGQY